MNKKILIHVGTGKTGSTAIQKGLSLGDLNGICYPLPLGGYHHQQIAALYYKNYEYLPRGFKCKYSVSQFQELKYDYKKKLFDELSLYSKIILCSEYLGNLNLDQVEMLKSSLDSLGKVDYRIIIYIREPSSYYLSSVQQQLKASSKFVSPSEFHYPFLKAVTFWSKVFSPRHLKIRVFQPSNFPKGSVLLDFKTCIEEFFDQDIVLNSTARSNESISAEGMIILQKYRSLIYPQDDDIFKIDSNFLLELLQKSKLKISQTKPRLVPEVIAYIRDRHQRDIKQLRDIYGIDLKPWYTPDSKIQKTKNNNIKSTNHQITKVEDILESFSQDVLINTLLWVTSSQLSRFVEQRQKLSDVKNAVKAAKRLAS